MEDSFGVRKETDEQGNSLFYGPDGKLVGACGIVKPPERVQYERFIFAAIKTRESLVELAKILVDEAFPGDGIAQVGQAIDTIDSLIKARSDR